MHLKFGSRSKFSSNNLGLERVSHQHDDSQSDAEWPVARSSLQLQRFNFWWLALLEYSNGSRWDFDPGMPAPMERKRFGDDQLRIGRQREFFTSNIVQNC